MGGGGFPERVARADLGAQDAALQGVEEAPGDRGDLLRGVREVGEVGPRHLGRLRGEGADVERADVAGGLAVAHEVPVDREGGDGVGEAVVADPVVDAAILSESSTDGFERFFAELSQGKEAALPATRACTTERMREPPDPHPDRARQGAVRYLARWSLLAKLLIPLLWRPRMHIRSIRINNVRSLRSHQWSFAPTKCAGWHVVLGDNGSGKSTFLRSIALALVGSKLAESMRQSWSDWLTKGEEEGEIRLEIGEVDGTSGSLSDRSRAAGDVYDAGLRFFRYSPDSVQIQALSQEGPPAKQLGDSRPGLDWRESAKWFCVSFGPFRRFSGGDTELSSMSNLASRHLSLFDEGVTFTGCLDWMRDLKFRTLESDPEGELLEQIVSFVNETDFLPSGVRIDDVTSRGVLFRDANGVAVSVTELSDGYRSVLSMTFEIIRQMSRVFGPQRIFDPDHPGRIAWEGVVIVDEIDAHLHPTWQSRIGRWFCSCFPNVQFIVSTHSPLVCQSAGNGSVYLLPRSGSTEKGGKVNQDTLKRLVHGTVLDAYGTDAFGSEAAATRSPESRELHRRLAVLNNRELLKGLSSKEKSERDQLRRTLPSGPLPVD